MSVKVLQTRSRIRRADPRLNVPLPLLPDESVLFQAKRWYSRLSAEASVESEYDPESRIYRIGPTEVSFHWIFDRSSLEWDVPISIKPPPPLHR